MAMALPARSLEPAPPVPVPGYNGETFLLNELAGPSSSSSLHTHTRTHTPTLSSLCSAFHSKRLVYFSETRQVIPQQQQTKIQSPSGSSLPVYDTLLLTFSHSALSFASRGEHYHFHISVFCPPSRWSLTPAAPHTSHRVNHGSRRGMGSLSLFFRGRADYHPPLGPEFREGNF